MLNAKIKVENATAATSFQLSSKFILKMPTSSLLHSNTWISCVITNVANAPVLATTKF